MFTRLIQQLMQKWCCSEADCYAVVINNVQSFFRIPPIHEHGTTVHVKRQLKTAEPSDMSDRGSHQQRIPGGAIRPVFKTPLEPRRACIVGVKHCLWTSRRTRGVEYDLDGIRIHSGKSFRATLFRNHLLVAVPFLGL